ncbi:hypothetical protein [Microvirga sp. Mcv34]|uniref:hypothetical protein n=1 Tax=Microvirga sp. Mcv34 TaxID=2926016 RepID=UPI0021C6DEC7|nr:hypothetical protein [Microvirga sp. Mcv34]
MKLYRIWNDLGESQGTEYFGSMREAERGARAVLNGDEQTDAVEISLVEIVPLTKANLIEILNSSGGRCEASSEVVKTIRRKGDR